MTNALTWAFRSDVESKRFSLQVFRACPDFNLPPNESHEEALFAADVDVLIARVNSGEHQIPRALASKQFEVRYADSLVYYSIALNALHHRAASQSGCEVTIRMASASDASAAAAVSKSSFANYSSHYSASADLFPREAVADGYAQWAESHILAQKETTPAFVATRSGKIIGFLTCAVDKDENALEVLLNAVDIDERRRGVYSMLLDRAIGLAADVGCRELRISTQVANIPVQRAWAKLGLRIYKALDTYHIRRIRPDRLPEVGP